MTHPALNHSDSLNLGLQVGKFYKIWTGDVDEVLGYDVRGRVWVRDLQTGVVRSHLTAKDPRDRRDRPLTDEQVAEYRHLFSQGDPNEVTRLDEEAYGPNPR
jgi:hypothetical protein